MRIRAKIILKNYELESRRMALGYTQKEFAEICGMNTQRYGSIELMQVKPREEECKSIALELDTDINILFPDGYERIVDVLKEMSKEKLVDYTVPALESDNDYQLLLQQSNAKITAETLLKQADLPPKLFRIIEMRHGLDGKGCRNLDEVGKEFGVTRERIRQMEAKALEYLRTSKAGRKLFENGDI